MIKVKSIESIEELSVLKHQYICQVTAPLDGMWLSGFVPAANHFGFYKDEKLMGYFCINSEGYLLQFYVCPESRDQASHLFDMVLKTNHTIIGSVHGAFVSTAEPHYLSLCLDHCSTFKVNALMYQLGSDSKTIQRQEPKLQMDIVRSVQLEELIDFARLNMDSPEQWLRGYYANLINRQELFGYWKNGHLLAAGESRGYDKYQTDYADLGIIVDGSVRGKGLATNMLKQLIAITEERGLIPICSTEKENIGAQKAINRAGFVTENRIIQFDI